MIVKFIINEPFQWYSNKDNDNANLKKPTRELDVT